MAFQRTLSKKLKDALEMVSPNERAGSSKELGLDKVFRRSEHNASKEAVNNEQKLEGSRILFPQRASDADGKESYGKQNRLNFERNMKVVYRCLDPFLRTVVGLL